MKFHLRQRFWDRLSQKPVGKRELKIPSLGPYSHTSYDYFYQQTFLTKAQPSPTLQFFG